MDLKLQNKTALITGASKGIGYACALRLAKEGCNVRLVARNSVTLSDAKHTIETQCPDISVDTFALDLSEGYPCIQELMGKNEDIDILINNAGAIPNGNILEIDDSIWRNAWELKVFGYINLCRETYATMSERKKGIIINIIGAAGDKPIPGYIAGSTGNAALMALTTALGATSLKQGIRVVGVNPGLIETDRLETQLRRLAQLKFQDAARWRELLSADFPAGKPEHIADTVAFLASDLSAFTTGTIVTVDGGTSVR